MPHRSQLFFQGCRIEQFGSAVADMVYGAGPTRLVRQARALGLLAIDGRQLLGDTSPYELLLHKADRPVELTVNDSPTMDGARRVAYQPITDERSLRYLAMQLDNQRRVEELSDGRVGYLHLPDMGASGIQEFIKWYYPQIRRQGLIIDVRANGGGSVSAMIIERLRREVLGTRFGRVRIRSNTPA